MAWICMVAREYGGLAEAGGVKDVVRSLSEALVRAGDRVSVIIPRYGFMDAQALGFRRAPVALKCSMDYAKEEREEEIGFWSGLERGVELVLVEAERFAEKRGVYTYTPEEEAEDPFRVAGRGHFDYFAMNCLLQKAALAYFAALGERPDLFHCHDGHAALIPPLIRELDGFRHFYHASGALITIHNAGKGYHQEVADLPFAKANTGLPWRVVESALLNGAFDPLLAGPLYSPVNTVSENYARELQETELDAMTGWLGHALRKRGIELKGITNGIDPDGFDPRLPHRLGLPAAFDPLAGDLAGKRVCRRELFKALAQGVDGVRSYGLKEDPTDLPLLTVVSRFTRQKGMDLLAEALVLLSRESVRFAAVLLGNGEREIEERMVALVEPGQGGGLGTTSVNIGFNQKLANLIYAAGDFFVIPSLYEPCGLTDFMAQLMGNIPVVHATGGLVKVEDGFNGFSYKEHSAEALCRCLLRAISAHRDYPQFIQGMRVNAIRRIKERYTWDQVAKRYKELYRRAKERGLAPPTR